MPMVAPIHFIVELYERLLQGGHFAGRVDKATSKERKPVERSATQVVVYTLPTAMTGRGKSR
jgi:hypothetical protein